MRGSRAKIRDRRKLPTIIKIGVFKYTLEHWDPAEADEKECLGLCDRFNFIIYVRSDLPDSGSQRRLSTRSTTPAGAQRSLKAVPRKRPS
jgi:hypothetical protein